MRVTTTATREPSGEISHSPSQWISYRSSGFMARMGGLSGGESPNCGRKLAAETDALTSSDRLARPLGSPLQEEARFARWSFKGNHTSERQLLEPQQQLG